MEECHEKNSHYICNVMTAVGVSIITFFESVFEYPQH